MTPDVIEMPGWHDDGWVRCRKNIELRRAQSEDSAATLAPAADALRVQGKWVEAQSSKISNPWQLPHFAFCYPTIPMSGSLSDRAYALDVKR